MKNQAVGVVAVTFTLYAMIGFWLLIFIHTMEATALDEPIVLLGILIGVSLPIAAFIFKDAIDQHTLTDLKTVILPNIPRLVYVLLAGLVVVLAIDLAHNILLQLEFGGSPCRLGDEVGVCNHGFTPLSTTDYNRFIETGERVTRSAPLTLLTSPSVLVATVAHILKKQSEY